MPLPLPDPQLPGNPQDALQSIQRNFEAIAQTLAPPVPTGTVLPYAAATAPEGYLICDGSEKPVKDYPALDALLGTTYGARTNGSGGAGSTHFRLPDLQGRVVVSKGTHSSVNDLGENDGTTTVSSRRPAHSHSGSATTSNHSGHNHGVTDPGHSHTVNTGDAAATGTEIFLKSGNGSGFTHTATTGISIQTGGAHDHTVSMTVGSTGGTTDAPSYIVLNHIIKA